MIQICYILRTKIWQIKKTVLHFGHISRHHRQPFTQVHSAAGPSNSNVCLYWAGLAGLS